MRRLAALAVVVCALTITAKADTYVVLPFFNVSQNANLDWIGESLSESIHEALAFQGLVTLDREERVEVYHRLSIRPYALLTRASVVKIAETLDAEHVIYGQFDLKPVESVSKNQPVSRGSLQITAHMLDRKRVREGPEFAEVGSIEDLAVLQRHLSWQALHFVLAKGGTTAARSASSAGRQHRSSRSTLVRGERVVART